MIDLIEIESPTISLGQELRRIRKTKGLTMVEVAKNIGITDTYLYMIETGKRNSASFEVMARISDAYEEPLSHHLAKFV